MPVVRITPIIRPEVRDLCKHPYHNHPHGCPNYGKKPGCPPHMPLFHHVIDMSYPVYAIYTSFDLAAHVMMMRERHPDWSYYQLRCCLYWQGTARANLRRELESFTDTHRGIVVVPSPEAYGVDVTATMAAVDVRLSWPPLERAYQVAMAGTKKETLP